MGTSQVILSIAIHTAYEQKVTTWVTLQTFAREINFQITKEKVAVKVAASDV